MKTPFSLLLLSAFPLLLHGVEIGDTRQEVMQELGEPTGYSDFGHKALMMYPQGKVNLVENRVVAHTLVDRETWVQQQQERVAAEQARVQRDRQAGETLFENLQASDAYTTANPSRQLEMLDAFRTRYPGIDISGVYVPIREEVVALRKVRGEALAEKLRQNPRFLVQGWRKRLEVLESFGRQYPVARIDDLVADAVADRTREMEGLRQREEMARLQKQLADAERERSLESQRRMQAERERSLESQRRLQAERDFELRELARRRDLYNRPYPVYVPFPGGVAPAPAPVARPAAPAATPQPVRSPFPDVKLFDKDSFFAPPKPRPLIHPK